jgi:hypothetical protein
MARRQIVFRPGYFYEAQGYQDMAAGAGKGIDLRAVQECHMIAVIQPGPGRIKRRAKTNFVKLKFPGGLLRTGRVGVQNLGRRRPADVTGVLLAYPVSGFSNDPAMALTKAGRYCI